MRDVEKLIVALLLLAAVAIPACVQNEGKPAGPARNQAATAMTKTPSGLAYEDLKVGTGPQPTAGKPVKVHYTGWLENGTKFDSSLDRNEPFVFIIGVGQVVPGWDEGVMTMRVGGKRKLVIPPQLGYGSHGAGGVIPPDATLVFEVELLDAAN